MAAGLKFGPGSVLLLPRAARCLVALALVACAIGCVAPVVSRAETGVFEVRASEETQPVPHGGDAADDATVWVHPTDPAQSTIIGTDKLGGLAVYDLAGQQLHFYADSRPNNVDLQYGFPLAGDHVALVATSSQGDDTIRVYRVDPITRNLSYVAARSIATGIGVAGLCMYRSRVSGQYFVFVSDNSGTVQQWRLYDNGLGAVDAEKVRTLELSSTTEGCVADDDLGDLYVAQEDVAIWKFGAEPNAGTSQTRVDSVGAGGHLTADIEGLTIYYAGERAGYLIASSQGSDTFVVYERGGANAYLTTFAIVSGKVDGVSHTDGIAVVNFGLGNRFPQGVFVAQDNDNGSDNQNFKLVPWQDIARSGDSPLSIETCWDQRRTGAPGLGCTSRLVLPFVRVGVGASSSSAQTLGMAPLIAGATPANHPD